MRSKLSGFRCECRGKSGRRNTVPAARKWIVPSGLKLPELLLYGDGLHTQLNKLDSIWSFRLSDDDDHDRGNVRDARFVALGRDTASEQDSILLGTPGFQNEGDNEPTGTHVSNGDPSIRGMLGTERSLEGARVFFTQQHGLNRIFEVVRTDKDRDNDRDRDRD